MIQFYQYSKCGTCRKAKKLMDQKKISYMEIDITLNPPSKTVLKKAVAAYGLKKLFNTSGMEYKEKKIKDKIDSITKAQVIDLLSKNGRLVKRPILVDGDRITVGFDEEKFKHAWLDF